MIFFHHGAGYTAQTWIPLIRALRSKLPQNVCYIAFDMRCHGKSTADPKYVDMGLRSLVEDVDIVMASLFKNASNVVDVHLVGHSLGAAVLASFSKHGKYSAQRNRVSHICECLVN